MRKNLHMMIRKKRAAKVPMMRDLHGKSSFLIRTTTQSLKDS
jgi:hypothetical protein